MKPTSGHRLSPNSLWLRRFGTSTQPRQRLVCFAHAGGSASLFSDWHRWLPEDVELVAVKYPGRQDRIAEPCPSDMDETVTAVERALHELPRLPMTFFGHSMGALLAFLAFARMETNPSLLASTLVVSAARPPHRYEPRGWHLLSDEELLARLRPLGQMEGDVLEHPEMLRLALHTLRADFRMLDETTPDRHIRVGGPIIAFSGTSDPSVTAEEMTDWAETTHGTFSQKEFPGGHFYLLENQERVIRSIYAY